MALQNQNRYLNLVVFWNCPRLKIEKDTAFASLFAHTAATNGLTGTARSSPRNPSLQIFKLTGLELSALCSGSPLRSVFLLQKSFVQTSFFLLKSRLLQEATSKLAHEPQNTKASLKHSPRTFHPLQNHKNAKLRCSWNY